MSTPAKRMKALSGSSCSSVDSTENAFELEYVSDNSTSNVESATSFHLVEGEFDCSELFEEDGEDSFKTPHVLKKEFVFDVDKLKQEENDPFAYQAPKRQPKCQSKNAVMARLNRVKKKKYVENLQKEMSSLTDDNKRLRELVRKHETIVKKLEDEVKYLKNIIANSAEVGKLLKCVSHSTGLPVRSALRDQKLNAGWDMEAGELTDELYPVVHTKDVLDPDYFLNSSFLDLVQDPLVPSSEIGLPLCNEIPLSSPMLPQENATDDIGICLHVAKKRVSLEFCSSCHSNGQAAWEDEVF